MNKFVPQGPLPLCFLSSPAQIYKFIIFKEISTDIILFRQEGKGSSNEQHALQQTKGSLGESSGMAPLNPTPAQPQPHQTPNIPILSTILRLETQIETFHSMKIYFAPSRTLNFATQNATLIFQSHTANFFFYKQLGRPPPRAPQKEPLSIAPKIRSTQLTSQHKTLMVKI